MTMSDLQLSFDQIVERAMRIRARYHELEIKHHGSEWSVSEDALAFLTDAGLVGRLTMANQGRWDKSDSDVNAELAHKLCENIWWQIVLAGRLGIDIGDEMKAFLVNMERRLSIEKANESIE